MYIYHLVPTALKWMEVEPGCQRTDLDTTERRCHNLSIQSFTIFAHIINEKCEKPVPKSKKASLLGRLTTTKNTARNAVFESAKKRHGVCFKRNLAPFHWCSVGFHPALFLVFGPPLARSENWSKRGSRILWYGGRKPCRTKKTMGKHSDIQLSIPELEISDETILQTPTIIENNNIMNETDPNSKINNSKIIQFLELNNSKIKFLSVKKRTF